MKKRELPSKNPVSLVLIGLIKGYQIILSPYFPSSCRYQPTCSRYAIDALKEHGVFRGLWLSINRILRCHPWSKGGHDPVPPRNNSKPIDETLIN